MEPSPLPRSSPAPGSGTSRFRGNWGGLADASLTVTVGDETSPAAVVPLAIVNPGIFVLNTSGQAAALVASTDGVVAGPEGSFPGARPARPGETIEVLATGLGRVSNQPATGAAALADPVSDTVESVSARVGGDSMTVISSGLRPSFAGLYQVEVELADDVTTGDAVPARHPCCRHRFKHRVHRSGARARRTRPRLKNSSLEHLMPFVFSARSPDWLDSRRQLEPGSMTGSPSHCPGRTPASQSNVGGTVATRPAARQADACQVEGARLEGVDPKRFDARNPTGRPPAICFGCQQMA